MATMLPVTEGVEVLAVTPERITGSVTSRGLFEFLVRWSFGEGVDDEFVRAGGPSGIQNLIRVCHPTRASVQRFADGHRELSFRVSGDDDSQQINFVLQGPA